MSIKVIITRTTEVVFHDKQMMPKDTMDAILLALRSEYSTEKVNITAQWFMEKDEDEE